MESAGQRFITIGEIVNVVGLRGELKFYPLLDFHEPLLDSAFLVWSDGTPAAVARHRVMSGGCWGLGVRGVETREAAEAMVGRELGFLDGSYLDPTFPKPAGGLPFRWVGREVITGDHEPVGVVDEVRRIGGQHLLVILEAGGEILIPALAPILRPEDALTGPLVIDPPEGLLDVQRG